MSAKKSVASRASRVSAFSAGPERFTSRRAQLPRTSFSVDVVVQERFKKMIRFKRVMAAYGLLNSDNSNEGAGAWNLTDQDGVDELVHLFELDERPLRPSMWGDRMSRMTRLSSRPSVASNAQLSKISEEV